MDIMRGVYKFSMSLVHFETAQPIGLVKLLSVEKFLRISVTVSYSSKISQKFTLKRVSPKK